MHSYLVSVQSSELDENGVPVETLDYVALFEKEQDQNSLQESYDSMVDNGMIVVGYSDTGMEGVTEAPHWILLSVYTEDNEEF